MANELCTTCQQLSFQLHLDKDCEALRCTVKSLCYVSLHSAPTLHSQSIVVLQCAAHEGCHLCSLLLASLVSSARIRTDDRGEADDAVYVIFNCSNTGERHVTEEIITTCGNMIAVLPVTAVPRSRCDDPNFLSEFRGHYRYNYGLEDARHIKFRAIYTGRDNAVNDGYVGQTYDVFDVQDEQWLVRPVREKYSQSWMASKEWISREEFGARKYPVHFDCTCGKGIWETPLLETFKTGTFHGIPQDAVPLIQDWLRVCSRSHTRCMPADSSIMPSRLVEIVDWKAGLARLVDTAASAGRYVALSYRWGTTASETYVTCKDRIQERRKSFSIRGLPRTIRDAIEVTHWLGLRFIWIDAICIIQDSIEDWQNEGARMDAIYAGSYLTISAEDTLNTAAGFLHQRSMLGRTTCIHDTLDVTWAGQTSGWTQGERMPIPTGPRAICCGVVSASAFVNNSILNERGWILQERTLSHRILHWSSFEISWECNEMFASERAPDGVALKNGRDNESISRRHTRDVAPWERFRGLLYPRGEGYSKPEFAWHDLVVEFTRRQLTKATDRLPAILGLVNAFGKAAQRPASDYMFGVWKGTLLTDLCWYRIGALSYEASSEQPTTPVSLHVYHWPSFTWANVNSAVTFGLDFHFVESLIQAEVLHTDISDCQSLSHFHHVGLISQLLPLDILPERRVDRPTEDASVNGERRAILWDNAGEKCTQEQRGRTVCLVMVLVEKYDGMNLAFDQQFMFRLLLQPVEEMCAGRWGTYRRTGFYDGPIPNPEVKHMKRETVIVA